MGDILVYKFDDLERCSSRMGEVSEALSEIKTLIDRVNSGTDVYWQGRAHNEFTSRLTSMTEAVEKLYEQVEKSREKLDKAIDLERQNEEDLTNNTVGRLSADKIF